LCAYCEKNRFYALAEVISPSNTSSYNAINYVVDSTNNLIQDYSIETPILSTLNLPLNTFSTTTTIKSTSEKLTLLSPIGSEVWITGQTNKILWESSENITNKISLQLYCGNSLVDTIVNSMDNLGYYDWKIPTTYPPSSYYTIRINWLVAGLVTEYAVSPSSFTITAPNVEAISSVIKAGDSAAGIAYSLYNNQVIIMLKNGLLGFFDMKEFIFLGLINSNINNVYSLGVRDRIPSPIYTHSKVRIFVGSAPYLNDKWDSGEINTNLNSMYYGGGNNLLPGRTYFVNLQVFSEKYGWSEIQTRTMTMPFC
jgi:hypothetical protein